MKRELYTLTTLSNLHVGSGDINFDVIDKQVQRDAITTLPTIHSSSLKGAFREATGENQYSKYIFGPKNDENENHQTGAFHFFEASLLSRPVRSNKKPYYMATSVGVIENFLTYLDDFDVAFDGSLKQALESLCKLNVASGTPLIFDGLEGVVLEDLKAKKETFDSNEVEDLLGANLALFAEDDFKSLDLPVLARNYLVNGESKNLWYEEVVPKKTRFYFIIAKPTNLDDVDKKENLDAFESKFDNQTMVQFGGNKSIGYGYCKLKKVSS